MRGRFLTATAITVDGVHRRDDFCSVEQVGSLFHLGGPVKRHNVLFEPRLLIFSGRTNVKLDDCWFSR